MTINNLLPSYISHWGSAQAEQMIPAVAYNHLGPSDNPYQPGSPQWEEFKLLADTAVANKVKKALSRHPMLTIDQGNAFRRCSNPKFSLTFDSLQDATLRLSRSAIYVGKRMYLVQEIYDARQTHGDFLLILMDSKEEYYCAWYKDTDLRSPEPQYVIIGDRPYYLIRPPHQQQTQGVHQSNVFLKPVGKTGRDGIGQITQLLEYFDKGMDADLIYGSELEYLISKARVLSSVRLSRDIALYRKESGELFAEFRGRDLGRCEGKKIYVAEEDAVAPWIQRCVDTIGCELRTIQ